MMNPMIRSGEASGVSGRAENLPLIPATVCSGDGCEAVEPWPLHHFRHRNNFFLRLCSSCVLKYHPGSFCCSCFEILDSTERPPLVLCSKCPSVAHLSCLTDPSIAPLYLCPACDSPSPTSFSYFPFSKFSADRVIDLRAAKILFTAARFSAASMSRAAAIARAEAEKKVKEAALARKRARDMLNRSLAVSEKEKEKIRDSVGSEISAAKFEAAEPKKKSLATGAAVQKRAQERESEKWKRFSEPILLIGGNEKIKGHLNSDVRDGVTKDEETEIGKQE